MQVEVSGHSDDIVHVDGDLQEEFDAYKTVFLHFGDGTVLEASYAQHKKYYWRIEVLKSGEGTDVKRLPGTYDGCDGYRCDKLELAGDLKSVDCWSSADGPANAEIVYAIEDRYGLTGLSNDRLMRILAIVKETQ